MNNTQYLTFISDKFNVLICYTNYVANKKYITDNNIRLLGFYNILVHELFYR